MDTNQTIEKQNLYFKLPQFFCNKYSNTALLPVTIWPHKLTFSFNYIAEIITLLHWHYSNSTVKQLTACYGTPLPFLWISTTKPRWFLVQHYVWTSNTAPANPGQLLTEHTDRLRSIQWILTVSFHRIKIVKCWFFFFFIISNLLNSN